MSRRRPSPSPSPSTYEATGFWNFWRGFHTDSTWGSIQRLAWFSLRYPGSWPFTLRLWQEFVRHFGCDTTDFHHQIYCVRNPNVRALEEHARWIRVMSPLAARRRCVRCRCIFDRMVEWQVYDPRTELVSRGWCPDCGRRENDRLKGTK